MVHITVGSRRWPVKYPPSKPGHTAQNTSLWPNHLTLQTFRDAGTAPMPAAGRLAAAGKGQRADQGDLRDESPIWMWTGGPATRIAPQVA